MHDLVWYAAYGSNLWPERFMVYLNGGTAPGSTVASPGARDTTPPRATERSSTNYERFFAGVAKRWHGGGVAFLGTQPGAHDTLLRLYLVTAEQFEDVFMQENGLSEPIPIDFAAAAASGHADLATGWYGRLLHLGTHDDGHGIFTFTSANPPPRNPPHESYLATIRNGEASLGAETAE